MVAVHKFRSPGFRKKVTEDILEMLAQLAEAHRNIFVWSHYRGYKVELIAEILGCSSTEVETTLGAINSILYQKIRSLLAEDPQGAAETELQEGATLEEARSGGNAYGALPSGFKGHNLLQNGAIRNFPVATVTSCPSRFESELH